MADSAQQAILVGDLVRVVPAQKNYYQENYDSFVGLEGRVKTIIRSAGRILYHVWFRDAEGNSTGWNFDREDLELVKS